MEGLLQWGGNYLWSVLWVWSLLSLQWEQSQEVVRLILCDLVIWSAALSTSLFIIAIVCLWRICSRGCSFFLLSVGTEQFILAFLSMLTSMVSAQAVFRSLHSKTFAAHDSQQSRAQFRKPADAVVDFIVDAHQVRSLAVMVNAAVYL